MIAFFLCFGHLSMVWLKQWRWMRIRRRSILARRIQTEAFCENQEAELRAAVTVLATHIVPNCPLQLTLDAILAPYLQKQPRPTLSPRSSFSRHLFTLTTRSWRKRVAKPSRNPARKQGREPGFDLVNVPVWMPKHGYNLGRVPVWRGG